MKNVVPLFVIVLATALGWIARGWYESSALFPTRAPRTEVASPLSASTEAAALSAISGEPVTPPAPMTSTEAAVPDEVLAPIATVDVAIAPTETAPPAAATPLSPLHGPRPLIIPVAGVDRSAVHDTFNDARTGHRHEAIDIMAPRGTPVIAADEGIVAKLFTSVAGGLTIYEFDPDARYCYYYAHLDRYAARLHEGQRLNRGEIIGYVGSTGNASADAPHLHFALIRLDPEKRWWKGTYVNPYPLLNGPLP